MLQVVKNFLLCIHALATCCYAYFISKGYLCHSLGMLVVLYFHTDYQIVQIPVFVTGPAKIGHVGK